MTPTRGRAAVPGRLAAVSVAAAALEQGLAPLCVWSRARRVSNHERLLHVGESPSLHTTDL